MASPAESLSEETLLDATTEAPDATPLLAGFLPDPAAPVAPPRVIATPRRKRVATEMKKWEEQLPQMPIIDVSSIEQRLSNAVGEIGQRIESNMREQRMGVDEKLQHMEARMERTIERLEMLFNPQKFAVDILAAVQNAAPSFTAGQYAGQMNVAGAQIGAIQEQVIGSLRQIEADTSMQAEEMGAAMLGVQIANRLGLDPAFGPVVGGFVNGLITEKAKEFPMLNMIKQGLARQGAAAYMGQPNGQPQFPPNQASKGYGHGGWS